MDWPTRSLMTCLAQMSTSNSGGQRLDVAVHPLVTRVRAAHFATGVRLAQDGFLSLACQHIVLRIVEAACVSDCAPKNCDMLEPHRLSSMARPNKSAKMRCAVGSAFEAASTSES
jgi:hypothetical protein